MPKHFKHVRLDASYIYEYMVDTELLCKQLTVEFEMRLGFESETHCYLILK